MKERINLFVILVLLLVSGRAMAQEVTHLRPVAQTAGTPQEGYMKPAPIDTAGLGPVELLPRLWMPEPCYLSPWSLHEGLNAQLGMDVSVAFGHSMRHPVGIGTTAAFVYAMPITSRLAAGAGIVTRTMDWGGWRERYASLLGVAAYRVNDYINIYAFGTKRLVPEAQMHRYGDGPAETIGGAAGFSLGRHAFLQIGVTHSRNDY